MPHLTLGHRIARELSRRGNRRAFFATELRRIDSIEELADFLDRTGYRVVRASADVDEVAGDIVDQRNARGAIAAGLVGIVVPVVGFVAIPAMLLWRMLWKDDRTRH